jgi:ABC-2 type transport system permease protein
LKHFLTLLSHEVRMLLVNPSTYIAAVMFLGVMGFMFTGILETYSKTPQDTSPAHIFFYLFWFPAVFIVPLLTMRCLAEERRLGTLETLLTTPVTTTEVVLAKYSAAYLMYVSLWACTGGFFYILYKFAGDARFLDSGPLIGGYLFIAVSGLLFTAVGVFTSSLSRNQAVAGVLSFAILAGLIGGVRMLADATWLNRDILSPVKSAVEYAQIFSHYDDFTRGVIDVRQLIFYLSGTALALVFSILSVEVKLLHS